MGGECSNLQTEGHSTSDQTCSSLINCYDGSGFSCMTIPDGSSLNEVLAIFGNQICANVTAIENISTDCNCTTVDVTIGPRFDVFNGTCLSGTYLESTGLNILLEDIVNTLCNIAIPTVPENTEDIVLGSTLGSAMNSYICFDDVAYDQNTQLNVLLNEMADLICANAKCCLSNANLIEYLLDDMINGDESDDTAWDGDVVIDYGGTAEKSVTLLDVTLENTTNPDENRFVVSGKIIVVADTTVALTANMDNYVDVDTSGNYTVSSVTIGNPAPAIVGMRLYKFETNATTVAATTDMRNYYYFNGTQFSDNSIGTRHIIDANVTNVKLDDIVTAATTGDPSVFTVTYNAKGRVTAAVSHFNITAPADGDITRYHLASGKWVNYPLSASTLPAAVARQMLFYDGAAWQATSLTQTDGSNMGFGFNASTEVAAKFIMNHNSVFQHAIKAPTEAMSLTVGGSLAPSTTFYYSLEWRDAAGGNTIPKQNFKATTGTEFTITVGFSWPKGAATCRVWRSTTSGTYTEYFELTTPVDEWIDDGTAVMVAGTFPTTESSSAMQINQDGLFMGVVRDAEYIAHFENYRSTTHYGISVKQNALNPTADVIAGEFIANTKASQYNVGVHCSGRYSGKRDFALWASYGNVYVGADLVDSRAHAGIQLNSTTKGILNSNLTTVERDAMNLEPADAGMMVFNSTIGGLEYWNGTSWISLFTDAIVGYNAVRTDADITLQNRDCVIFDCTSAAITAALPPVADSENFLIAVVKEDVSVNQVTVDPNGAETISGAATKATVAQWDKFIFFCDGTQWLVL